MTRCVCPKCGEIHDVGRWHPDLGAPICGHCLGIFDEAASPTGREEASYRDNDEEDEDEETP